MRILVMVSISATVRASEAAIRTSKMIFISSSLMVSNLNLEREISSGYSSG